MTTATTTGLDAQDPLPEASWLWRRVFTFAVTFAVLWMLWQSIDRLATVALTDPQRGVPALLSLCQWIIGFSAMMVTYYMVAPSAEQIVKIGHMAGMLRSGVQFASHQSISTPAASMDTAATAGTPPAPPVPPLLGEAAPVRVDDEEDAAPRSAAT